MTFETMKIVALAGGVGGAKLADGLAQLLPPENLTIVVNTGDDFEHLGLWISPDLDTVCYTLAGLANTETGWGRQNETWRMLENLSTLQGPDWFRLGDSDLATHLERTRRLRSGEKLTDITKSFCDAWQIATKVLPMSDDPAPTVVLSEEGDLPFQEYFVQRRCEPRVSGFRFDGDPKPSTEVINALTDADLVIFCPSNPWVSIDPILNLEGVLQILKERPVIAVSPIIQGQALKGPAAKMYQELGFVPSVEAVAKHYREVLNGLVIDRLDQELEPDLNENGIKVLSVNTWMRSSADRLQLAKDVVNFYLTF